MPELGAPLEGGRAVFSRTVSEGRFRLENMRMAGAPGSQIFTDGRTGGGGSRVEIHARALPLASAARAAGTALDVDLEGTADIEAVFAGPPGGSGVLERALVFPRDAIIRFPGIGSPIERIRGTLAIGPDGATVRVREADFAGGKVEALVQRAARPGDPEGGFIRIRGVRLENLATTYKARHAGTPAAPEAASGAKRPETLQGTLDTTLHLSSLSGPAGARGEGVARIRGARLARLPQMLRITDLLNLRWPSERTEPDQADVRFRLEDGRVRILWLSLVADPIRIVGEGTIEPDGRMNLLLAVRTRARIPILGQLANLGHSLYLVQVTGTLDDPKSEIATKAMFARVAGWITGSE